MRYLLIFLLVSLFCFESCITRPIGGSEGDTILVFSKTAGYRHASIEAGITAVKGLGLANGFKVESTENASDFTEDNLAKYKAVIFLSTTMDVLNDNQQAAFEKYIQAGNGFVGVHAAADTEYDWEWYGKLVGAYFESHPNNPNIREAKIIRLNKRNISTKHLDDEFTRNDEWYNYKNINPNINVLLNLDETSYEGGTNGDNHPIAWYHEFDGGRAFYTGGGHTAASFTEKDFLQHLLGGIFYAMGN